MSVQNKVIVITGASAGIGAAVARQLGDTNNVVLAARREPELKTLADWIGERALAVPTDVTQSKQVEHLRDKAIDRFGRVDVWINNAGRGISRPVLELTDDDFDEMMLVNVKSALYGMQAIVPHFIERGSGQVINVSSFLGRVPVAAHRSAYNAAKAALNALTANLRMDLRRSHPNIQVTLVMPGVVNTEFGANVLGDASRFPIPQHRDPFAQTPEEVADVVVRAIEHPVAEVFTNPRSAELVRSYFADVEKFEQSIP
jgi:NADP-dependent 3-hydroxy acid dehydrogenase YdfG